MLTMGDIQANHAEDTGLITRPRLHLHGGPRLSHNLACSRRFVFRTGMPLTVHENRLEDAKTSPSWSDDNIQVWAMPISMAVPSPESSKSSSEDAVTSDAENEYDENSGLQSAQEKRQSIIHDMFDSDWRKDRLVEKRLMDVKCPAVIFVRDSTTKSLISHRYESVSSVAGLSPDSKVYVRNPWPASLVGKLPPKPKGRDIVMSYVVKGHVQRGKFDSRKALELGIPPGSARADLAKGITVQREDGSSITPDMVLGPDRPGRGIAIMDIPDKSHLPDALHRSEWTNSDIMAGVEAVVWILGSGVASDGSLQEFIKARSNVKHIISSPDVCPNYLTYDSSAASAIRLSRIWSEIFPIPIHDNLAIPQSGVKAVAVGPDLGHATAQRGLKIAVEPKFELQQDEVEPFLDTAQVIRELSDEVITLAQQARSSVASSGLESEPEIITLGTGSAAPSKYRNVSATLLRIPLLGSYLFDCGENTLGQLRRLFGPEELDNVLTDLKMIWISHLHADHHLGTLGLLQAHRTAVERKIIRRESPVGQHNPMDHAQICVVGEKNMGGFLDDYGLSSSFALRIVASRDHGLQCRGESFSFTEIGLPIERLDYCPVSHCAGALAVSATFKNGFKFSYSGDCRPSQQFAHIGQDSDVLVHEATFDDGMEGDALAKKHCTTGEALAVAAMMRAKNVILTHFSQRYQKIPVMSDVKLPKMLRFEDGDGGGSAQEGPVDVSVDDATAHVEEQTQGTDAVPGLWDQGGENVRKEDIPSFDMNLCVAFDYMRIKVSQITEMAKFTPALKALFEVEQESEDVPDTSTRAEDSRKQYLKANTRKWQSDASPQRSEAVRDANGTGVDASSQQKSKKQIKREAKQLRVEQEPKEGGDGGPGQQKKAKLSPSTDHT